MLSISVESDVWRVVNGLDDLNRRHVPFARVLAMTMTAKDAKEAEYRSMQSSFDRPTRWTLNALRVIPATKSRPEATVDYKEGWNSVPPSRFLMPNIAGGPRSQKSHEKSIAPLLKGYSYLAPGKAVKLDAYGNMPPAVLRKIVSQLKVSGNADANASAAKRSKRKRSFEAYFVSPKGDMVLRRHSPYSIMSVGKDGKSRVTVKWHLEPTLVGIKSPRYSKRFPFFDLGRDVVSRRFALNFETALARSIATSGYRGGWR